MIVPIIDFTGFDSPDPKVRKEVTNQICTAMSDVGFMALTNLPIKPDLITQTFSTAQTFFAQSSEQKAKSGYHSAEENFGYQGVGVESLDPASGKVDQKETFTLRNAPRQASDDTRWPDENFRQKISEFYGQALNAAYAIQRLLAEQFELDEDFFVNLHQGENVTLRLLHYPEVPEQPIDNDAIGAGAHTDYGMLTLLFQSGVSGLEVQTDAGDWQTVEPNPNAVVINTGDLMERWTNGKFRSTPHRVRQIPGNPERFSIALFVDPDSAAPIEVLETCLADGESPQFPMITAGDYITGRIEASHALGK